MTFAVEAEIYDRFVGRYGDELGRELARRAGVEAGMRALDVGAGTGKLTGVLAQIVGEENVAAIDPSEPFVAALRERFPAAEVRSASAEELPFADGSFDAVLAQLVVNFLSDPERGVEEMLRVARAGGVVAAAVWDYGQEMRMLTTFWEAAAELNPRGVEARDERSRMPFGAAGGLAALWRAAGAHDTEGGEILVSASYEDFDDLWEPFRRGVGPAGAYAASLERHEQDELRDEYFRRLGSPEGPFELTARAWYAVGSK
jgi:SAM-dependent methyltransferase